LLHSPILHLASDTSSISTCSSEAEPPKNPSGCVPSKIVLLNFFPLVQIHQQVVSYKVVERKPCATILAGKPSQAKPSQAKPSRALGFVDGEIQAVATSSNDMQIL
jgi:hypothetical protein